MATTPKLCPSSRQSPIIWRYRGSKMCSGSAMCGNSTAFKGNNGSHCVGINLSIWSVGELLTRGGCGRGLALNRRGAPARDRARQQGAEEQDRDWNHERGPHGGDEGLGKHVMREPLHLRRFGSRNTLRERYPGLAAPDLEHAARRFGKALHK